MRSPGPRWDQSVGMRGVSGCSVVRFTTRSSLTGSVGSFCGAVVTWIRSRRCSADLPDRVRVAALDLLVAGHAADGQSGHLGAGAVGEHPYVRDLLAAQGHQRHGVRQGSEVGLVGGRRPGRRFDERDVRPGREHRETVATGPVRRIGDGGGHGIERGGRHAPRRQLLTQAPPSQLDLVRGVRHGAGGVQVDRGPRAWAGVQRPQVRQVHESAVPVAGLA